MRVLALEPFYGGSHRAFLDGWIQHSEHEFTALTLPPRHWKWRMRHAAMTLADQLQAELAGDDWDVLWCSDMLNLAEFVGLVHDRVGGLPRVVYFHENQLSYPVRYEDERDLHFAYTNFVTAVAAHEVWFNSNFHRLDFLEGLRVYLSRMPDYTSAEKVAAIESRSLVLPPGITSFPDVAQRDVGPLRVGWNARWEHDKNPAAFFAALQRAQSLGARFHLIVLGESFGMIPEVFVSAKHEFAAQIEHWGFAESTDAYRRLLQRVDVLVSTANHEFFGIGAVEAIAAGAVPLLPDRLAYPEIIDRMVAEAPQLHRSDYLYDGSTEDLAARIRKWSLQPAQTRRLDRAAARRNATRGFSWPDRAAEMDARLRQLA